MEIECIIYIVTGVDGTIQYDVVTDSTCNVGFNVKNKNWENVDYEREGFGLHIWCKKHGLGFKEITRKETISNVL